MLNRRQFLALGVMAGGTVHLSPSFAATPPHVGHTGYAGLTGHTGHTGLGRTRSAGLPSAKVSPFSVRMPVPPVLKPIARRSDADVYSLAMRPAKVEIFPGLLTPVLTYGGQYVGPTIRARRGRKVLVDYRNRLDMPANAHLHGGHVPADSDGHPMNLVQPGASQLYRYPNAQPGATMWYHDHTHMMEVEHVYRGMHGFYLLEDEDERRLGLPDGPYDVPIMLSEANVLEDGTLYWSFEDGPNRTFLANGRPLPYFPVAARKYRFRLLNASTSMFAQLRLEGAEMVQIGSDGGLLPAPLPLSEAILTSGERVEIVVDFSRKAVGESVTVVDAARGPVLRFDVVRQAADRSRVPDVLRPLSPLPPPVTERDMVLSIDPTVFAGQINGKTFDADRVDIKVKRGTSEIWRIVNADTEVGPPGGVHHNFHTHLVQFRVLDRDGKPPLPEESGLKDTVRVDPGHSVRVQAVFKDYVGRYTYHCHILEHSAMGMMGQMEVVP